jgi:hypothetical protein
MIAFRSSALALPLSSLELPIITAHDALFAQSHVFGFNQYGKAALGFLALKDLLGDAAFRTAPHAFMALVPACTDGCSERVHLTPAAWQADGRRTEVRIAGGKALRAVSLDTGIFVDANPAGNSWKGNADGCP